MLKLGFANRSCVTGVVPLCRLQADAFAQEPRLWRGMQQLAPATQHRACAQRTLHAVFVPDSDTQHSNIIFSSCSRLLPCVHCIADIVRARYASACRQRAKMPFFAQQPSGSPLTVPTNDSNAVLYVSEKDMYVLPMRGEGARLQIRSEVVSRSTFLQSSAACPCTAQQIIQVPYDAFVRYFIFVVADMGAGGQAAASVPASADESKTPPPLTSHIERCTTEELLQVFMVRVRIRWRRRRCARCTRTASATTHCHSVLCQRLQQTSCLPGIAGTACGTLTHARHIH